MAFIPKKLTVLISLLFIIISVVHATDRFEYYEKLEYSQMRQKLKDLNTQFPDIVRLENAKDKFGIEYLVKCGED